MPSVGFWGTNTVAGKQSPLQPVKFKPIYQSQQPRFVVKIDGNPYLAESYRCTFNAHGATDTATIVLPVDGATAPGVTAPGFSGTYPDWTVSIERSDTLGNADSPVLAEIWAGFPTNPATFSASNPSGLTLRFRGVVDMYTAVLEENRTTFTCRSLAAPLTSHQITTPFPRQNTVTTVAWIQQQAARFGLAMAPPILGTNPKFQYGGQPQLMIDVLGGEFISGVHSWYIWNLMLQCAQLDDVDIWVDRNGVLHYQAASAIQRQTIEYVWGSNCKGLSSTHSPQFSKNVVVRVHSWVKHVRTTNGVRYSTNPLGGVDVTHYSKQSVMSPIFGTTESLTTTYSPDGSVTVGLTSSTGGGSSAGTGYVSNAGDIGREIYTFFPKNKTLQQCHDMAERIWRQISMHEYSVKITAPVTSTTLPLMDVTALIKLYGHPMARFNSYGQTSNSDQFGFWPREILETFDIKNGWAWEIDCVNHELPQAAV